MSWSLIKEIGIEYAPRVPGQAEQRLNYPTLVERCDDGSRLIVDVLSMSKVLTVGIECRTIRVGDGGQILYDTAAREIHDGYGCAMDGGFIAIMRRSTWEILIVAADGSVQRRLPLWNFTKRMPRVLTWTHRRTFLISFVDSVYQTDIIEIDAHGKLLWHLPAGPTRIGCPSSVQLLPSDHILVADDFSHVALELRCDGSVVRQYGEARNPSDRIDRLSSPACIREAPDGRRVIADTRNHRILAIDRDGKVETIIPADGFLSSPTFAEVKADGHWLIADAGNGRAIELDRNRNVIWQFGNTCVGRRDFSFPRTVEPSGERGLLVADTANNRVVEVCCGNLKPCAFADVSPLFWPRSVRRLASQNLLIADGRNGRVIEVSPEGKIVRKLDVDLKDPHDASVLPDGKLLIVDPLSDRVLIADWNGKVFWSFTDVKDPHSAQFLVDGNVLICDSGNHRLIYVNSAGEIVRTVQSLRRGNEIVRLNRPRHVIVGENDLLIVVDTGNNRVVAADARGEIIWILTEIPGSPIPDLDQPRWAHPLGRDEVLVCDHYHHRILHLRHDPSH